ncbi:uncharacterized protein LOC118344188 [Juglans regia]|uniref:Uncharacterized protein LOC118344188 n=1 Tax=Juglans regia TaxID=51240 RepID=A0A6P9DWS5_JUGRE|nr:uncharacterized protein LOC118344188 [Juglans regia]XP_035540100.1 uncharacterized protein LOC118344188 [Juglans regia]
MQIDMRQREERVSSTTGNDSLGTRWKFDPGRLHFLPSQFFFSNLFFSLCHLESEKPTMFLPFLVFFPSLVSSLPLALQSETTLKSSHSVYYADTTVFITGSSRSNDRKIHFHSVIPIVNKLQDIFAQLENQIGRYPEPNVDPRDPTERYQDISSFMQTFLEPIIKMPVDKSRRGVGSKSPGTQHLIGRSPIEVFEAVDQQLQGYKQKLFALAGMPLFSFSFPRYLYGESGAVNSLFDAVKGDDDILGDCGEVQRRSSMNMLVPISISNLNWYPNEYYRLVEKICESYFTNVGNILEKSEVIGVSPVISGGKEWRNFTCLQILEGRDSAP